jgi:hypothetical protein
MHATPTNHWLETNKPSLQQTQCGPDATPRDLAAKSGSEPPALGSLSECREELPDDLRGFTNVGYYDDPFGRELLDVGISSQRDEHAAAL